MDKSGASSFELVIDSINAVKVLFANGVNISRIDSATVFNSAVLMELSKLIKEKYNKDLPFS